MNNKSDIDGFCNKFCFVKWSPILLFTNTFQLCHNFAWKLLRASYYHLGEICIVHYIWIWMGIIWSGKYEKDVRLNISEVVGLSYCIFAQTMQYAIAD